MRYRQITQRKAKAKKAWSNQRELVDSLGGFYRLMGECFVTLHLTEKGAIQIFRAISKHELKLQAEFDFDDDDDDDLQDFDFPEIEISSPSKNKLSKSKGSSRIIPDYIR